MSPSAHLARAGDPAAPRRGGFGPALVLAAACLLAALPAAGDWLVTRDQGRVETRGPWEVQGRLVVFHLTDGTLSSLRLDEVDLEASHRATRAVAEAAAEAAAPEEPATAAPEPERRRITTADIGPGTPRPAPEDDAAADAGAGEAEPETPSTATRLVVLSSQEEETLDGHVRISGSLANQGEETTLGVSLTVFLQGTGGEEAATTEARLSSRALTPGEVVSFQADFPDVFAYAAVAFRASGSRMATIGATSPAPAEGDDEIYDGSDDLYEPEADLYDPEAGTADPDGR